MRTMLLTPRNADGDYLYLRVSPMDAAKVKRGCRWQATVTDLHSLKVYVLRDAACHPFDPSYKRCHCAARVISRRELDPKRD